MRPIRAACVLVMVFTQAAAAQTADPIRALMIATSARGEPTAADPGPLPLVEERLQVTIDGQFATTTLWQAYLNKTGGQLEGRYRLQPGLGSHVEGFAYWNGEQKIVGEVFERKLARQVYENVTSQRRDPGLLEEDGAGAFAFKVFPIAAGEKKPVQLVWTKWLEQRGRTVQYRAPVTRGDASIAVTVLGAPVGLRSSTHKLAIETVPGGQRVRATGGKGELVLTWDVDQPDWTPHAYVHASTAGDSWFALSLATPAPLPGAVTPKDVTIVIDRSGSMQGVPLEQAKLAAADMIARLDAQDRVNVIAFSDEVDPLFQLPQPLAQARQPAIEFVTALRATGGTDLGLALATGIKSQATQEGRPRVMVFMTDGQSSAEAAMAAAEADRNDVRLFTVGLGSSVNRPLLARLAAGKRGRFVYIEDTKAITTEVGRLAQQIAKPLLVDVSLDVEGAQALRVYPRSLPDLYALDELVVAGRLRGTGPVKLTLKGTLGGKAVAFTRTVDIAKAPARPWVGRLWAQQRVAHLLEEIELKGKQQELVDEVTELALAYNFVTPYTAFLAIPESELGTSRDTVMAARARKAKIMADSPDVAELDGATSGKMDVASYAAADDEDSDVAPEPLAASGEVARRGGCAGCATGQGDARGALLLVALVLLVRRRGRASVR